jgi:hypothetical protein
MNGSIDQAALNLGMVSLARVTLIGIGAASFVCLRVVCG